MFEAGICPVGQNYILHLFCGDFSILRGNGQNLVAGSLHSAGLVAIDMAGDCTQSTLMGPQSSCNHGHVCLCATHHEVNGQRIIAAGLADLGGSAGAVMILAVAGGLFQVGALQGFQNLFMAAFAIVIVKINHDFSSKLFNLTLFYLLTSLLSRPHILPTESIGFSVSTQHRRGAYDRYS